MKKVFLVLLIVLLGIVLVGCSADNGGGEPEKNEDSKSKLIIYAIRPKANSEMFLNYGSGYVVSDVSVTTQNEIRENVFECFGYVTFMDSYRDMYKAKFDAVVIIYGSDDAECKEFNMSTPIKQ